MESSKSKNFIYLFCAILFLITLIPQLFQSLFVHSSGKFVGMDTGFAIVLISTILLRWKHSKLLFNFVLLSAITFEIFILSNIWQQYFLSHLLFLIAMIGLTVIFNFSKTMQSWFVVNSLIKIQR
ncbi:MAG: hypothetical protein WAR59_02065 [Ignavibacteriaceae bacterium]